MAIGISAAQANAILDAYARNQAYTQPAAFWVKLHLGDPGSDGTANAAVETTRKQATFSAASGGATTTSGAMTWNSVAATEQYSHISFWDDPSAGNFLGSDALDSPQSVVAGGNFTIAAGDVDLSITPVAA